MPIRCINDRVLNERLYILNDQLVSLYIIYVIDEDKIITFQINDIKSNLHETLNLIIRHMILSSLLYSMIFIIVLLYLFRNIMNIRLLDKLIILLIVRMFLGRSNCNIDLLRNNLKYIEVRI